MRTVLMFMVIGLSAWGCLAIIGAYHGVHLPLFHGLIHIAVWNAGPPILLISSLIARVQARRWRRMESLRDVPTGDPGSMLARGGYSAPPRRQGSSGLERLCAALAILGVVALLYW